MSDYYLVYNTGHVYHCHPSDDKTFWLWENIPSPPNSLNISVICDNFREYPTRFRLLLSYARVLKRRGNARIMREHEYKMMKELMR